MKKIFLILAGSIAVMFSSCIKDEPEVNRYSSGKNFKLNLTVVEQESEIRTRASIAPEEGEETVRSLYLLFFEDKSNGAGVFLNYYKVNGPFIMNKDIVVDFQDGGMGGGDPLNNNTAYRILAIANLFDDTYFSGTVEDWLKTSFTAKTEAEILLTTKLRLLGNPSQTDYNYRAIKSDEIPMSASFSKAANQEYVKAELTRAVIRIDVHNRAREQWDLVSASVWNAYRSALVWKNGYSDFVEARIKRLFGVETLLGGKGNDGYPVALDIVGKLYAFENFVSSPEGRDEQSTCIIVGAAKRNGDGTRGAVSYHRVNIVPAGSSQFLKRNHVYKITINNVTGAGAPDELTAYTQNENRISYTINSWDLDDNGMVLIDGTNTLVVPVKKIVLKPEGDMREFSVFTMGPGELRISRAELDNGLSAVLTGNRLTVTATPLGGTEEERKGAVVLSLGSLDATIDIIQTRREDLFLNLNLHKIIDFPSYGTGMPALDGDIIVSASGPWTAKIFNPTAIGTNQGFSFSKQELSPPKTVITSSEVTDNTIKIYTTGDNQANETRYAFIIVSLNGHDDINRSLVLSQKPASGVKVLPEQSLILFNSSGVVQGNATFTVEPGIDDKKPAGQRLNKWAVELIDTDADKFEIYDLVCDLNETRIQSFKVRAKGLNESGIQLNARVRAYLVGISPAVETFIHVRQDRTNWNVPTSIAPVSFNGGITSELSVSALAGLTYKVEVQSLQPAGITDHFAYLIDPDEGNNKHYSSLKRRDVSKKFAVGFPKLIYPNTDIQVQATIAVTLIETGETKTFVVTQSQVSQFPVNILNVGNSWGRLAATGGDWSPSYNQYFVDYLRNANNFGPDGVVKTNG